MRIHRSVLLYEFSARISADDARNGQSSFGVDGFNFSVHDARDLRLYTPYSEQAAATITVLNPLRACSAVTAAIVEDAAAHTVQLSGFSVAAAAPFRFQVTSLPARGALFQCNLTASGCARGGALRAGDMVAVGTADGGGALLVYVPPADEFDYMLQASTPPPSPPPPLPPATRAQRAPPTAATQRRRLWALGLAAGRAALDERRLCGVCGHAVRAARRRQRLRVLALGAVGLHTRRRPPADMRRSRPAAARGRRGRRAQGGRLPDHRRVGALLGGRDAVAARRWRVRQAWALAADGARLGRVGDADRCAAAHRWHSDRRAVWRERDDRRVIPPPHGIPHGTVDHPTPRTARCPVRAGFVLSCRGRQRRYHSQR